ncbi:hypothetical protein GGR53DRAFT_363120 [Hypoxylon sp. FL1150]|nr:hypothetical protein GGR53DRAFT_363120 [Hypoxylon sp. FL1150]
MYFYLAAPPAPTIWFIFCLLEILIFRNRVRARAHKPLSKHQRATLPNAARLNAAPTSTKLWAEYRLYLASPSDRIQHIGRKTDTASTTCETFSPSGLISFMLSRFDFIERCYHFSTRGFSPLVPCKRLFPCSLERVPDLIHPYHPCSSLFLPWPVDQPLA